MTLAAHGLMAPDIVARPRVDPATALVERLHQGDPTAVASAYDQYEDVVRALALRLVGDADSAEDLVQEVFVALPAAIKRFRGESSLGTFLVSMAIHRARSHVRSAARRRAAMERYSLEPHNPIATPEHAVARQQMAVVLSRALDQLPLDQRVVFVLCEVEERTSAEVSVIVSAPEATVRTRLFYARRKLRESLAAEGYHDAG